MDLKDFKIVGFFREQGHFFGLDLPSIHEARLGVHLEDQDKVHAYLLAADDVTLVMEASPDLIAGELRTGEPELAGGPSLYSDGTWIWPRDLAYYFRKYGLALPEDFLTDVRDRDYQPPELNRLQRMRLRQWQARHYS
jgi:hypothetical protein